MAMSSLVFFQIRFHFGFLSRVRNFRRARCIKVRTNVFGQTINSSSSSSSGGAEGF
jgi:hypothetical protein